MRKTIALNRYNIIERPDSRFKRPTLCFPPFIEGYSHSSWRGAIDHWNRQDNPNSDEHKSENNVANIERNNPARRTNFCLARACEVSPVRERDRNNNGGKRRLMTNLRFSFRNRSFSRFLIILSILWGGLPFGLCCLGDRIVYSVTIATKDERTGYVFIWSNRNGAV